jgi:MtrB/PioB family decaheme-associated outer membrane protein
LKEIVMTEKMSQTFKVTALAAALLAAYGPALAGEGLVSEPNSVSVGVGGWSNDRLQRGVFDGMRDSGVYSLVDAYISQRDDATGTWLGLKVRNGGLGDQEIKAEWLRQGDIGVSLEYSRIPRVFPYVYNTGLQGFNTTTQTVVDITPGSGTNLELGTHRDRVTADFVKHLGTDLKFNVSFRDDHKQGTRPYSRGGAPEFAVEPVDSTIRLLEATLSYSRDGLQLSGGYYGSSYSSENKLITAIGSSTYYLSQPMDSSGHELFLNGGYSFTPTARGTFKLSYSMATQDEHLPTADVLGLANAAAPTHLDGKIVTTMAEIGLTARPLPKLSVVANLRYRDFDDQTPVHQYVFDVTAPITNNFINTPFSYKDTIGKLQGTYRLVEGYSVLGSVEYKSQDRTAPPIFAGTHIRLPFAKQLDTTDVRLQLRKSMSESVNGSLAYVREQRRGKDYVEAGQIDTTPVLTPDPSENLIHPMHIADRDRDKVRAMLDWSPSEALAIQLAGEGSSDKYGDGPNGNNPLGLQKGTGSFVSADASYQVASGWAIHAWVSRDESKADEITVGDGGDPERKTNKLTETGTSVGIGVKGNVSGRLKVGGDVEHFRSVNEYNQTLSGGATLNAALMPVPDITNRLLRLKLYADYALQKNVSLRFDLVHERWKTDDWSWTYFPGGSAAPWPYGQTTDGTTVLANPEQNSTFLGARVRVKF